MSSDERVRAWWERWYLMFPLGAFLAAALLLAAMNWVVMPVLTRGSIVQVPDLYGLDVAVAKRMLLDEGLIFLNDSTDYVWDEYVPANHVVGQNPAPYTEVKTGRRVRVIISRGPQSIAIPDLRNLSPVQAKLVLEQQGFAMGAVRLRLRTTEDRSDPYVLEQDPPPGEMRPMGTPIDLVVSIVPEMPDLTARGIEEARKIIALLGLQLGAITSRKDDALLPRSVVEQSIPPGARIHEGDRVNLTLGHW